MMVPDQSNMHCAKRVANANHRISTYTFIALNVVKHFAFMDRKFRKRRFRQVLKPLAQVWFTKGFAQIARKLCKLVALFLRYFCIVKLVTFIFALFLFGSSVSPCSDNQDIAQLTEVSFLSMSGGGDHGPSTDFCSPLCVCHCCHSHLVVQQLFFNNFGKVPLPTQTNLYTDPLTEGFEGSILQPPQA